MSDAWDEEALTTLEGVTSGRFFVLTQSGARHLVDLDLRTVTRYGPSGAEWTSAGIGFGAVTADCQPMQFTSVSGATVGENMAIMNDSEWRITSRVESIVPASETQEEIGPV
ncbi:MAG TPA: hypothetical protein VFP54_05950 [Acidimicrobiales bacterium]|nr:hypothetical protein [Acidimicrobiales bacterium]